MRTKLTERQRRFIAAYLTWGEPLPIRKGPGWRKLPTVAMAVELRLREMVGPGLYEPDAESRVRGSQKVSKS